MKQDRALELVNVYTEAIGHNWNVLKQYLFNGDKKCEIYGKDAGGYVYNPPSPTYLLEARLSSGVDSMFEQNRGYEYFPVFPYKIKEYVFIIDKKDKITLTPRQLRLRNSMKYALEALE
jgi:hypothetical protein